MDNEKINNLYKTERKINDEIKGIVNNINLPFSIYVYRQTTDNMLEGCTCQLVKEDRHRKLFKIDKISLSELKYILSGSRKNIYIDFKKHPISDEQFETLGNLYADANKELRKLKQNYKSILEIELPFELTCICERIRPIRIRPIGRDAEIIVSKNNYKVVSIFKLRDIVHDINHNFDSTSITMWLYKFNIDGKEITEDQKEQLEQIFDKKFEEYYKNCEEDNEHE